MDSEQNTSLAVAIEDRFVIARMWEPRTLLPNPEQFDSLVRALQALPADYTVMFDLRKLPILTEDVLDAFAFLTHGDVQVLVQDGDQDLVERLKRKAGAAVSAFYINEARLPVRYHNLDMKAFDDDDEELDVAVQTQLLRDVPQIVRDGLVMDDKDVDRLLADDSLMGAEVRMAVEEGTAQLRREVQALEIQNHISRNGRNSLLNEFAIQLVGDRLLMTPYHTKAYYEVETKDQLLLGRPAAIARRTGALLREELQLFERLINDPETKERELQAFLVDHSAIFKSMGYTSFRSEVVLQREDGGTLRPDFFVRLAGQEWWDIIELKRPSQDLKLVGRTDFRQLAYGIQSLIAQLRKYHDVLDDDYVRRRLEEEWGIKAFRPRLIGVVGRSAAHEDELQARRELTRYTDISLHTWDDFLELGRSRLLI